ASTRAPRSSQMRPGESRECRDLSALSELEPCVHEYGKQEAAFVDVLQPLPEFHGLDAADEHDVVAERRAVAGAAAQLDADVRPDFLLEEQRFHLLGLHEADVAGGDEGAQFRRDL